MGSLLPSSSYLEPGDRVEQRYIDPGKLLERKQEEQYRHGFPSGRLKEAAQLVGHVAVLAAPLLAQFNFVLLHDGGEVRLDHGHLALRRLVFVKPAGIKIVNR